MTHHVHRDSSPSSSRSFFASCGATFVCPFFLSFFLSILCRFSSLEILAFVCESTSPSLSHAARTRHVYTARKRNAPRPALERSKPATTSNRKPELPELLLNAQTRRPPNPFYRMSECAAGATQCQTSAVHLNCNRGRFYFNGKKLLISDFQKCKLVPY